MNRKIICTWGMVLSIAFGIIALIIGIVYVSKLQDAYDVANKLANSNEGVKFSVIFDEILFPTFISIALTVIFGLIKNTDDTTDILMSRSYATDKEANNFQKKIELLNKEIRVIKISENQLKDETDAKLNEILQMLAKIQNPTSNDK